MKRSGWGKPEFDGTVVHDFWSQCFRYPCRHAICNAHLQRELQGITENFRHTGSESLHALLDEIRKTVETSRGRHMSSLSFEQQTVFMNGIARSRKRGRWRWRGS